MVQVARAGEVDTVRTSAPTLRRYISPFFFNLLFLDSTSYLIMRNVKNFNRINVQVIADALGVSISSAVELQT